MRIADVDERAVQALHLAILNVFQKNPQGTLWLFGCGGSASNASHIASEFVSHWTGVQLPAIALVDNPAVMTAIANDYGFEDIFSRQLIAYGKKGDLGIGLSTSGNAPAVLKGLMVAGYKGMKTSLWTGSKGGQWARNTDYPIVVNREWVGTIQERHLELGHFLSDSVCKAILDKPLGK